MDVTQILAAIAAGGDQLAEAKAAIAGKTPAQLAEFKAAALAAAAPYSDKAGELALDDVPTVQALAVALREVKSAEAAHAALAEAGKAALAELSSMGTDPAGNEIHPANQSQAAAQAAADDDGSTDKAETTTQDPAGESQDGGQAGGRRVGGRRKGRGPAAGWPAKWSAPDRRGRCRPCAVHGAVRPEHGERQRAGPAWRRGRLRRGDPACRLPADRAERAHRCAAHAH